MNKVLEMYDEFHKKRIRNDIDTDEICVRNGISTTKRKKTLIV